MQLIYLMNFRNKYSQIIGYLSIILICSIILPANGQTKNNTIERFELQGAKFWQHGERQKALDIWQQEAELYKKLGNQNQEARVLLNVAQSYITLGDFNSAVDELNYVLSLNLDSMHLKALVWEKLANSWTAQGKYQQAIKAYQRSLRFESSLPCLNNLVKAWSNLIKQKKTALGEAEKNQNIKQYQNEINNYQTQALKSAQAALKQSENDLSLSAIYALVNWTKLSGKQLSFPQQNRASKILNSQPNSRSLVFSLINWSKIDIDYELFWLQKAYRIAQLVTDPLSIAYTALELGNFYQNEGKLEQALKYSQEAQLIAQAKFLSESLFHAQWLAAKIYRQQNNLNASTLSYREAIATLDLFRKDLYSSNSQKNQDLKQIEPIYLELIDLLLEKNQVNSTNINQALLIADKLRIFELENFFQDDCFQIYRSDSGEITGRSTFGGDLQTTPTQTGSKKEAIFTSVILKDKTYVILQLPDGSVYLNKINISQSSVAQLAIKWRGELNNRSTWSFIDSGEKLYDLLIRPFEKELNNSDFEVLVFVHDGILRNIPMAALFDGEKFLAEKWASVSSLGANFTPKPKTSKMKALAFGLVDPPQSGWSTLYNVEPEVENVNQSMGGKKYLNQDFTVNNLTEQLEKNIYPVVHLATHSYFAGNLDNSFILAYDRRISLLDLEKILSNQTVTDLLVLSACETAKGSERAVLGLAGVAARSGVPSTLGSLWKVKDDEQSSMIKAFYHYWQSPQYNKATALQKIQIEQIKIFAHPQKWAALTLIGDYQSSP
jgi:CHAT domain-containing protein